MAGFKWVSYDSTQYVGTQLRLSIFTQQLNFSHIIPDSENRRDEGICRFYDVGLEISISQFPRACIRQWLELSQSYLG